MAAVTSPAALAERLAALVEALGPAAVRRLLHRSPAALAMVGCGAKGAGAAAVEAPHLRGPPSPPLAPQLPSALQAKVAALNVVLGAGGGGAGLSRAQLLRLLAGHPGLLAAQPGAVQERLQALRDGLGR
jgi:hypothetical protein